MIRYKNLKESSLSRLHQKILEHDVGIITAYRDSRDCGNGEKYTKKENQARNKSLLSKLQNKRYGVTSLKGSYIENYDSPEAKEVGEHVFFVEDMNDTGNLKRDLMKFGEEFEQDSILYIKDNIGYLIGTNHCPNGYPGYGKIMTLKKHIFGKKGEFFSRVSGRPFVFFESKTEDFTLPQGYFGRMGCNVVSKKNWRDLIE